MPRLKEVHGPGGTHRDVPKTAPPPEGEVVKTVGRYKIERVPGGGQDRYYIRSDERIHGSPTSYDTAIGLVAQMLVREGNAARGMKVRSEHARAAARRKAPR